MSVSDPVFLQIDGGSRAIRRQGRLSGAARRHSAPLAGGLVRRHCGRV